MTDETSLAPPPLLTELFRKSLSDALSQVLATQWNVSIADDQPVPADDSSLWYGLTTSGAVKGSASIQLQVPAAVALAQKVLGETAEPTGELTANHKQAIQDLLGKLSGSLGTGLRSFGLDTACKIDPIEASTGQGSAMALEISEPTIKSLRIRVQFDADLVAGVSAQLQPGLPADVSIAAAKAENGGESNLDLLLGVDLSVTLRFGQRTLTLREIMDLSSGSIIELDRQVQEPADLLLGDKLIARGEVVIVDGNYGLRIIDVAEPGPGNEKILRASM